MKIERIDDKTVKCFISNEELEEFEITYKDFITRSEKAKEVVEEIIEQAIEEVGYKPPQFAMDMQIMMMPKKIYGALVPRVARYIPYISRATRKMSMKSISVNGMKPISKSGLLLV